MKLRPMSEAPTTGPVVEVLVATTDRAGCKGWLVVHYADGGGEEQPRFRGWFYWAGYFGQVDSETLLGWLPLPTLRVRRDLPPEGDLVRLRPMSEAPTTGPVVEVLVATTDRAGCKGWLIAHYADDGGEERPRFRGWSYWTGFDFRQIDARTLIGWLPLPTLDER